MAKIISYNVNGIRAALRKDFLSWLEGASPDVLCLQEIKATPDQFDPVLFERLGFQCHWFPAVKKGYSGVAVLSKDSPQKVVLGSAMQQSDEEGRVLRVDFENYSVLSVYAPSGSNEVRQVYKMQWLDQFYHHVEGLIAQGLNLVIAGDYNICHTHIDIHNPVANKNSPGFLPEERKWFSAFLKLGLLDSFREFNTEPHHYTWWSYRMNARARNLGWRIDYQLVSEGLQERMQRAAILNRAKHSDHCPTLLELAD